jgi:small ligand-binding sensory domain FIST
VHADSSTHELGELIQELARRTSAGYLFGGLASGNAAAHHIANEVLAGGVSGVAFDARVALVSRVTQGCQPLGPARRISACERNVVTALDGAPALECLMRDLGVAGADLRSVLPRLRQVLVGLSAPRAEAAPRAAAWTRGALDHLERRDAFGADTLVRHLVGIDPARGGVAIAEDLHVGMRLAFCHRNVQAAARDLLRICTEVREELEPETLAVGSAPARHAEPATAAALPPAVAAAGALYVSCVARGGAHFGAPNAELAIVQQALGDVPMVGLFAAGEIARDHLYGYTGVLTVFAR